MNNGFIHNLQGLWILKGLSTNYFKNLEQIEYVIVEVPQISHRGKNKKINKADMCVPYEYATEHKVKPDVLQILNSDMLGLFVSFGANEHDVINEIKQLVSPEYALSERDNKQLKKKFKLMYKQFHIDYPDYEQQIYDAIYGADIMETAYIKIVKRQTPMSRPDDVQKLVDIYFTHKNCDNYQQYSQSLISIRKKIMDMINIIVY